MTTETVFLELPDVRVTNTKVTISGTTYFLPNITSVKLREDRGMRTTGIIIGVFALLLMLRGRDTSPLTCHARAPR